MAGSSAAYRACLLIAAGTLLSACAAKTPQGTPGAARIAADPELERRVTRLELQLLEKEAQIQELQASLDDARQEVVRAMAKLQTLASRAEAASAIAEAEVALQSLRAAAGSEPARVRQLLEHSAREFDGGNYGGALYLANQAKSLVRTARGGLLSGQRGSLRQGEVLFAVPLRLQALSRANVREGPGLDFKVLFTVEPGTPLVGHSNVEDWVRVSDETGRGGWVFHTLVGSRQRAEG